MPLTRHKIATSMEQTQTRRGLHTTSSSSIISKVRNRQALIVVSCCCHLFKLRAECTAAGQWNQQWPGYAGQPQPQYQYQSAQRYRVLAAQYSLREPMVPVTQNFSGMICASLACSYVPNGQALAHSASATPLAAPVTLQPPGTPTGVHAHRACLNPHAN